MYFYRVDLQQVCRGVCILIGRTCIRFVLKYFVLKSCESRGMSNNTLQVCDSNSQISVGYRAHTSILVTINNEIPTILHMLSPICFIILYERVFCCTYGGVVCRQPDK